MGMLLDVSKAFDMVSHAAIDTVLSQQGVPLLLWSVIRMMYEAATTSLGNFGINMTINRGIKQGDPLSPLPFNLVLNPILAGLLEGSDGFRVGAAEIAVTAYADDIDLSSSVEGMC